VAAGPARFAFLVHPLVPAARRLMGLRTGRPGLLFGARDGRDPDDCAELARFRYRGVEGVIVGVPLLPEQLLADQEGALRSMERAVQVAGPVRAVGLGSVLSVVAGRGRPLQDVCGLPVTTGNAATTWAAWQTVERLRARHPSGPGVRVGVIGAKGTVGRALVELLGATPDPQDLREFPLLVGSHTTGGTVDPALLAPGTALVDVALPPTLSGPPPAGVRVLPGERLPLPPGWRRNGWAWCFHLAAGYGPFHVYACVIEPLVAVLSGRETPWQQGRALTAATVREFGEEARRHGLEIGG
jgi:predicted amino acid dehydrogenase